MRNSRSSAASAGSLPTLRRRRSAGLLIGASSGYLSSATVIATSVYTSAVAVPNGNARAASVGTADDEIGELRQRLRARGERRQGADRGIPQLARAAARRGKSCGRGVRGLGQCSIGAGGLAEQPRVALHIENVILDLEGEAD